MKSVELQEKAVPSQDWVEESENSLRKQFYGIPKNVDYLIKVRYPLLEERKKMRQQSAVRDTLFKAWREKVAEKPHLAQPFTAEQMLDDEVLTFSLSREVNYMILELSELSFFNKGEVKATKYIGGLVANRAKAFGLLCRQCRGLKVKLEMGPPESKKLDPLVTRLQSQLQTVLQKKAGLEMQVQESEERCKILLTTNEAMQRELFNTQEKAQMRCSSFSRPPFSKVPQEKAKAQLDVGEEAKKASGKLLPKHQLAAIKGPGLEAEKSEAADSGSEKLVSVLSGTPSQTPLPQDTQKQLEWEKETLHYEQSWLEEEGQRLDDKGQDLEHRRDLLERQKEQWNQRQQLEQDLLWKFQLEDWQQLQQQREEQQRHWGLQQEQHQARMRQLQNELQKLQRQYEEQLLLHKEQKEEQDRWDPLWARREEQWRAWQQEDQEREETGRQWRQQLASLQKQLEAWKEEKAAQQLQEKKQEEEQRWQLQGPQRPWQHSCQQQQQHSLRQVSCRQMEAPAADPAAKTAGEKEELKRRSWLMEGKLLSRLEASAQSKEHMKSIKEKEQSKISSMEHWQRRQRAPRPPSALTAPHTDLRLPTPPREIPGDLAAELEEGRDCKGSQ